MDSKQLKTLTAKKIFEAINTIRKIDLLVGTQMTNFSCCCILGHEGNIGPYCNLYIEFEDAQIMNTRFVFHARNLQEPKIDVGFNLVSRMVNEMCETFTLDELIKILKTVNEYLSNRNKSILEIKTLLGISKDIDLADLEIRQVLIEKYKA